MSEGLSVAIDLIILYRADSLLPGKISCDLSMVLGFGVPPPKVL